MSDAISEFALDEIGRWSELKLQIIREYAKPYSQILAKQPNLYHVYIDGFAGAGMHVSKTSGRKVAGSPVNVLSLTPPFREYHLVELNPKKAVYLQSLFRTEATVTVHQGDCNDVVPNLISKQVRYSDFRRAFCLLDPYGLHLAWAVVAAAGRSKTIDLLLNFPMMDMNMNVLWHDHASVTQEQAARMTRYWGDESWQTAAYEDEDTLFGKEAVKTDNESIVRAFATRLRDVAGFKFVAEPLPMKNQIDKTVYYLLFASQKQSAHKIISDIFKKKRKEMRQ